MQSEDDCCICPEDNCPWCTYLEECDEENNQVIGKHLIPLETCLKDVNYEINRQPPSTTSYPLIEFDRKMKGLMQLGKPSTSGASGSDAMGTEGASTSSTEPPTLLHRLANQPFRMARNVQQKIHLNNVYIDDYSLFEALGHITDAEEARTFEGALRAAEKATRNAAPEEVEAAAVKGARAYRAQITDTVSQTHDNEVEVVGYIGITRM